VSLAVRERPPLRHTTLITTPGGKRYRWASDEPDPRNIPGGVSSSSTMPGGFEHYQASLPRRPGVDYADLDRLSTITERSAAGEVIGEFRLERSPRVSGAQMVINPSAVGWQAHLADNQAATLIVIDRRLGAWSSPSRLRQLQWIGVGYGLQGFETRPDPTSGAPSLVTQVRGPWSASPGRAACEVVYDAGQQNRVGRVRATWARGANVNPSNTSWWWEVVLLDADDYSGEEDITGNLRAAGPDAVDLPATASSRRYATITLYFVTGPDGADNVVYDIQWTHVRVFGDHNLPIYGSTPGTEGVLASDVVAHVVARFAPMLNVTMGPHGTVQPSTFVIPQLSWPDPTNAGEMVRSTSRFGLEDWAVWEDKTFYWNARGHRGRNWRARVAPSGLEETGPQIDRLWESVVVQYRDVDGTTRTVGPPGSGAGVEDAALKDQDPDNPANQLGITRRVLLQAGTLTAAAAIELGRRFLIEQKQLDSSGRARFVGHITDDHGVIHPYSHVRAGDTVTFIDAADQGARRIVRASHNRQDRSVTVDLDAPPEGLQALLERLGVTLAPLGL
jgi:hypothetical protein